MNDTLLLAEAPRPEIDSGRLRPAVFVMGRNVAVEVECALMGSVDDAGNVLFRGEFEPEDGHQFWLVPLENNTVLLIDRLYGDREMYANMDAALVAMSYKLIPNRLEPQKGDQ